MFFAVTSAVISPSLQVALMRDLTFWCVETSCIKILVRISLRGS